MNVIDENTAEKLRMKAAKARESRRKSFVMEEAPLLTEDLLS